MHGTAQAADESATQTIQDHSVIDHLIATFHSGARTAEPIGTAPEAVYDLIRREWPVNLTLGTRF
jgi:hypothetical protein